MYGSARLRAFYGAGAYHTGITLASAYAPGYYAAGGFFSGLKKLASKAVNIVSNPIVSTGLSFLPGGGLIGKAAGLAKKVLSNPLVKKGAALAGVGLATGAGSALASRLINPTQVS